MDPAPAPVPASSSSSSRKSSNKIRDIVRLQQILKKWKKAANSNRSSNTTTTTTSASGSGSSNDVVSTPASKSIKFLKKTLSFSEREREMTAAAIPKGYVAVCVGKELKRFVIPTEYLSHQVFGVLLREAEEEFGFQQEGVLKFPCEVDIFHKVLKMMEDKRSFSSPSLTTMLPQQADQDQDQDQQLLQQGVDHLLINYTNSSNNYSPDTTTQHRPQMCR